MLLKYGFPLLYLDISQTLMNEVVRSPDRFHKVAMWEGSGGSSVVIPNYNEVQRVVLVVNILKRRQGLPGTETPGPAIKLVTV